MFSAQISLHTVLLSWHEGRFCLFCKTMHNNVYVILPNFICAENRIKSAQKIPGATYSKHSKKVQLNGQLGPHTQNSLTYVDLSAKSSTFVSWA